MLRVLVLVLVSLLAATEVPAADLTSSENLFFIKRNKNTNEVHYDARVEDCAWSRSHSAVDSYWRELEDGQDIYEEIKLWEDPAYGFDVEHSSDAEITIRLKALPEKKITARLSQTKGSRCSVSVTIEIDGKPADLRSVYVYAEETFLTSFGLVPTGATVHYIYILGYSKDGQPVFERIIRTKQGKKLGSSPPNDSLWKSGAITMGRLP
jgi:hypothetical protein